MNILLLGGTGAMGVHLTKLLSLQNENRIFVTTRKEYTSENQNVTFVKGNAHDSVFLDSILFKEKWDVIVDFMVYTTEEFKFRAKKLLTSCAQYVFLSSSRVYADSKDPIKESFPRLLDVCKNEEYLATDEYALAKARQENILFENENKNWTIIRPYLTYSENRLQLGVLEKECWLYTAINCGALIFSNDISQHFTTLTYGFDVARGIASLIGKKKAFGEAFHITGNNEIKWQRVFEIYNETLYQNGFKCECILKDKTYRLNLKENYKVVYDRYFDRKFDNSKIGNFIDVNTFIKPEDGLKNCLGSFLKNPSFNYLDIKGILNVTNRTDVHFSYWKVKGIKKRIQYILMKMDFYFAKYKK